MKGQVGEVNLPVLALLVSSELVHGLECLEGSLPGSFGTCLAGCNDL